MATPRPPPRVAPATRATWPVRSGMTGILPNGDSEMARPRTRTDAEVLAAALRAVARHGVGRLTLAHVAAEAGLAPSTLAERFGFQRALLLAAARHAAGEVRLERGAGSPRAAAVDGLVRLAGGVGDRRAFAHSLALLELDVADDAFRAASAQHAAAVQAQLT